MKPLVKIMLFLASIFAGTFLLLNSTGLITVEKIQAWFEMASDVHGLYVAIVIAGLLFADLFVAVPTLTVIILGGYFLGPFYGALSAIAGLFMAGSGGYVLSRKYGDRLVNFLIRDRAQRDHALNTFNAHGPVVILLSRATPILPEVSACMAGMTGMGYMKFLLLWSLSGVPYSVIGAYAGSISTVENPTPAILVAIGLAAFFWLGWLLFTGKIGGR